MERVTSRENFLLGYAVQRSYESPRSSDVDFHDVFGGPPRRFSIHEFQYSSDGAVDSEETASVSGEKPVFGEECNRRRQYRPSREFFDDIFRGGESCSPRKEASVKSLPGSRVMSPSHPLPPKSEPFGNSLPAQFSLPATLTKPTDYPIFISGRSSKKKEGTSSGISSPNSSLSRFSSQTMQGQDDFFPSNPSPLSNGFSQRSEESSYVAKPNENGMKRIPNENANVAEASTDINGFHFSIYKWPSSDVPVMIPLRERIKSGSKSKEKDKTKSVISVKSEPFKMEFEKVNKTSIHKRAEACQMPEEDVPIKTNPAILKTTRVTVETLPNVTLFSNESKETIPNYRPEIILSRKAKKEVPVLKEEVRKPEMKPLHSILREEIDRQDNEDVIMEVEGKEHVAKATEESHSNDEASKNTQKHYGKRMHLKREEVKKDNIQGSPKSPGGNLKTTGVRGKVKEFVKIFNQEPSSKTKSTTDTQSQSYRWEGKVTVANINEESNSINEMVAEMHLPNVNKMPDDSFVVVKNVDLPEEHHSHMKPTIHTVTDNSSDQNKASPISESVIDCSKVTSEDTDDPFQINFVIQELSDDQVKVSQTSEDHETTAALDAKIYKWSSGKKGNIRSLLSTLQYVLWPESGWKTVPLVNIIEGNGVKRAYQKALLCLHPDKLQQKGATSQQKYTAEKVFDILQEAWDHFNTLGSI